MSLTVRLCGLPGAQENMSILAGRAGLVPTLSPQTGWWRGEMLEPFLLPGFPQPPREKKGASMKGRCGVRGEYGGAYYQVPGVVCPRVPLPARCFRASCTWLTSLWPPHPQACVFLEVMEMHFLKMLGNSALL